MTHRIKNFANIFFIISLNEPLYKDSPSSNTAFCKHFLHNLSKHKTNYKDLIFMNCLVVFVVGFHFWPLGIDRESVSIV